MSRKPVSGRTSNLHKSKMAAIQFGRLYAQLDLPQKVRFEINAVEVYSLL